VTGMTDDELARMLAAAVPVLPPPADRMDRVAARVRRRHTLTATGMAAVVVVTMLAAVALPRTWAAPRPEAVPPAASTPVGGDPICGPAPAVTPAPSPFGGAWPPRVAGAVRVTLCQWGLLDDSRYVLQRRLVVTDGVGEVVSTLVAAPDGPVPMEDFRCTDADQRWNRRLAFDFADGSREWVGLICDVLWQSSWQRYGGHAVLDAMARLSSESWPTVPPRPTFPPPPGPTFPPSPT
jgi:hypothetical protein